MDEAEHRQLERIIEAMYCNTERLATALERIAASMEGKAEAPPQPREPVAPPTPGSLWTSQANPGAVDIKVDPAVTADDVRAAVASVAPRAAAFAASVPAKACEPAAGDPVCFDCVHSFPGFAAMDDVRIPRGALLPLCKSCLCPTGAIAVVAVDMSDPAAHPSVAKACEPDDDVPDFFDGPWSPPPGYVPAVEAIVAGLPAERERAVRPLRPSTATKGNP